MILLASAQNVVLQCCLAQEGCDVLTENILVLGQLLSGMSSRAAGCEFHVNQSKVLLNQVSLGRNTHKTGLCVVRLIKPSHDQRPIGT